MAAGPDSDIFFTAIHNYAKVLRNPGRSSLKKNSHCIIGLELTSLSDKK